MDFLQKLFDTADFPARWTCGNWSSFDGWLLIVSDLLIFVAYWSIPLALLVILLRRGRDIPAPHLLLLFAAFILLCGLTHLIDAVIFWEPIYRVSGVTKALTAVVSLGTAVVLIRNTPRLLVLPGVQRANAELRDALAREQKLVHELSETRAALEQRSAQMSLRLRRKSSALASASAVACRWLAGDSAIDWEVGYVQSIRERFPQSPAEFDDWSRLLSAESIARLRAAEEQALAREAPLDVELTLSHQVRGRVRLAARLEPRVSGEPRAWIGMFRRLAD
jgi:hypothetical protein